MADVMSDMGMPDFHSKMEQLNQVFDVWKLGRNPVIIDPYKTQDESEPLLHPQVTTGFPTEDEDDESLLDLTVTSKPVATTTDVDPLANQSTMIQVITRYVS